MEVFTAVECKYAFINSLLTGPIDYSIKDLNLVGPVWSAFPCIFFMCYLILLESYLMLRSGQKEKVIGTIPPFIAR